MKVLTVVYQVEKWHIPTRTWIMLHPEKRATVTRMTAKRVTTVRMTFDRLTGQEILRKDLHIGKSYHSTALWVEDEQGNKVWDFKTRGNT